MLDFQGVFCNRNGKLDDMAMVKCDFGQLINNLFGRFGFLCTFEAGEAYCEPVVTRIPWGLRPMLFEQLGVVR